MHRLQKAARGGGRGGRPPYGYAWPLAGGKEDHTRWDIRTDEAERMRSWYTRLDTDEALTLRALIMALTTAQVPTPSRIGRWPATPHARMLSHPPYCAQ